MRKWMARKIAEWTSKGKSSGEQASGKGGRQAGAAERGGGAAGSSMFSAIRRWAQGVIAQQQAAEQEHLDARRDKEIQRLMDMLERDPDAGLKYALPMGPGSNDERRARRSGGELTENDSNFDRRRLDAQGESDPWVVPWQTHAKLQQRYRELAQREIRLGRHRRAAYIYAHLLKDFENAALALKAGRHFHDAAMLYLEKLRRPVVAAECFRDGGFWEEALQIFVNHSLWLQAADLASRLGRHSDATMYVQKRIDELVSNKMYELADNWRMNGSMIRNLRRPCGIRAGRAVQSPDGSVLKNFSPCMLAVAAIRKLPTDLNCLFEGQCTIRYSWEPRCLSAVKPQATILISM